jgi:hypothetical protein
VGDLPEYLKEQVKAAMRAAFRLPAQEGTSFVTAVGVRASKSFFVPGEHWGR